MGQYQLWCVHFVPAHQTGRPIAKAVSLLLYLLLSLNQRQQSHVNSSFIMYHVIMRSLPPSHGCHVMYQSSIPKVHSIHATWNYWIYIHRYLFIFTMLEHIICICKKSSKSHTKKIWWKLAKNFRLQKELPIAVKGHSVGSGPPGRSVGSSGLLVPVVGLLVPFCSYFFW